MTITSHDPIKSNSNGAASKKHCFLVGISPAISKLRELVPTIASAKIPVLILGESGVGKTAFASLLHGSRSGPLVSVNCASLTDTVASSELFGNVRGAFTGALGADGLLHVANEGTLFLDEVSSLSLAVQAMLLTPLDDGYYRRVGSGVSSYSSARFLCATNRDLDAAVKEGTFREDLLFRLAKIRLTIPPLRERMEDVPLLIDHALVGTSTTIDDRSRSRLIEASREFKGNVRQLFGIVEVAVVFAAREGATITLDNPALSDSFLSGSNLNLTSGSATHSAPKPQPASLHVQTSLTPSSNRNVGAPANVISDATLSAAVDSLNPYTDISFSGRGFTDSSYQKLASKIPTTTPDDLRCHAASLRVFTLAARKKFLSGEIAKGCDAKTLCDLTGLSAHDLYIQLSRFSLTLRAAPAISSRITAPSSPHATIDSLVPFIEGLGNAVVNYVEDAEVRSFFGASSSPVATAAVSNNWDVLTPFRKRQAEVVQRVLGFAGSGINASKTLKLSLDRFTRLCAILEISLPVQEAIEVPADTFDRMTAFVETLENPFEISLKSDRSGTALDPASAKNVADALSLGVAVVVECSRLNSDSIQKQIARRRAASVSNLHQKGIGAKAAIEEYKIPEGMLRRTLSSLGIAYGSMGTIGFTPQMICDGDSLSPNVLDILTAKIESDPFEVPILSRASGESALRFIAREYLKNEALYTTLSKFDSVILDMIKRARIALVNSETAKGKTLDQVAKDLKQTKYSLEQLLDLI